MAGSRVFTSTARSPVVRGGVPKGLWMCVCVCWGARCVWARTIWVGELIVGGLAPRSSLSRDAPHFPPLHRALPGGHPGSAASSVNTWLSKALCLDPIFVIYIFRNSTWSGLSDLLHREHSVLV